MKASQFTGMLFGFVFAFACIFAPITAYADDLVLLADADGLKIEPLRPGGDNSFFQIEQMTPGDSASATLSVHNTEAYAFALKVEVKDLLPDGDMTLIDALQVEVSEGGTVLANFPAKGGSYTFPEKFMAGSQRVLTIRVMLPIETGNEYQNKKASLQWVFTAEADRPTTPPGGGGGDEWDGGNSSSGGSGALITDEEVPLGLIEIEDEDVPLTGLPEMPDSGEAPLWRYLLFGGLLIGVGLLLLPGKKDRREKS